MKNIMITGANRGIGLALVKAFLAKENYHVVATCRDPRNAQELTQCGDNHSNLEIVPLDVRDDNSIQQLFENLPVSSLDILLNNAGAGIGTPQLEGATRKELNDLYDTNVSGLLMVTKAALPYLKKSSDSLVANISSILGSIGSRADTGGFRFYAYCASKCALNMASTLLAEELKRSSVGLLILHPGWVATRMGGEQAPTPPEESASNLLNLIEAYTSEQHGKFLTPDGQELPW